MNFFGKSKIKAIVMGTWEKLKSFPSKVSAAAYGDSHLQECENRICNLVVQMEFCQGGRKWSCPPTRASVKRTWTTHSNYKHPFHLSLCIVIIYSGIPIFRTSKGNGNWFENRELEKLRWHQIRPGLPWNGFIKSKKADNNGISLFLMCEPSLFTNKTCI